MLLKPTNCGLDWRFREPSVCGRSGWGGRDGICTVQGLSFDNPTLVFQLCTDILSCCLHLYLRLYHLLPFYLLLFNTHSLINSTADYHFRIEWLIDLFIYFFIHLELPHILPIAFSIYLYFSPLSFLTLILPYRTLPPYLVLPCLTLPYLVLPCLTLSYRTLPPYLILSYLTLPYHTLPYLTLPYLILSYTTLPYLVLPYLTVPYLVRLSLRQFRLACRSTFLTIAFRAITLKRQRLCVRAAVRYHTRLVLLQLIKR